MSKFLCVCGHALTVSGEIPNRHEWLYISDVAYDEYSGAVDSDELYRAFGRAFVCPISGHVWVFEHGMDAAPVGYAPISGKLLKDPSDIRLDPSD